MAKWMCVHCLSVWEMADKVKDVASREECTSDKEDFNFKINFNEQVKVKLTRRGLDILKQRHDEMDARLRTTYGKGLNAFSIDVDEEGYVLFQIWNLMHTFGEYMIWGKEEPFYGEMIMMGRPTCMQMSIACIS